RRSTCSTASSAAAGASATGSSTILITTACATIRAFRRCWPSSNRRQVLFSQRLDRPPRQFVGAVVHDVVGVALDPFPAHLVSGGCGLERAPEVVVLDRLLVGGLPAVLLPAVNPLGDA